MDHKIFFDTIRSGPLFGKSLKAEQVAGTEAIIAACIKYKISNLHHVAHILAHVYHETGQYMLPIKETVFASHKDKNPSDKTVIARLDAAFYKGQLPWVSKPYWKDGWFGRGPIQITHKNNYEKLGNAIGVDLVKNRDLALDPNIGAEIAVVGMSRGLFTGKKLSDYSWPSSLDADPDEHPRRIVNGKDGTDDKISGYHKSFYSALLKAGYSLSTSNDPDPKPEVPPTPVRTRSVIIAEIQALLDELKIHGG